MSEKRFHRMLLLSMAFHLVFLAVISASVKKASKTINPFLSSYSVNLVDDVGGKSKDTAVRPLPTQLPNGRRQQETRTPRPKKTKPTTKAREPQESVRSLTPKKLPSKESAGTTRDELKRLDERIKEMKRRTASNEPQTDVRRGPETRGSEGSAGLRGSGQGEHNSALVRYLVVLRDKIESAWRIPFVSGTKKNLETKITVKIRRDGRILDINIDKRSGNRAYDESVLRVLRAVDPLPPIPQSVEEDPLEVEMTLRPEGVS